MKRLIGLLLGIVLVVGLAGIASADTQGTVTLKVSCVIPLSVSISQTEYNFGQVAPRTSTISTDTIQVTNNSGGRTEDYTINSSTCTAAWNLQESDPSTDDNDLFSLKALLKSSQANESDYTGKAFLDTGTAGATSQQNMTEANFGTAGYDGDDVTDTTVRNIWFRLHTPWGTSTQDEQSLSVTITANDASLF